MIQVPSLKQFLVFPVFYSKRLVISSLAESFGSIVNLRSSEPTHSASGSVRNNSDQPIDVASDIPNYEWVDPHVLDVATYFKGPTTLDGFLSKMSILKPDAALDVVAADSCSHSDRVCHGRENAPQKFFFYVYITFFNDLHALQRCPDSIAFQFLGSPSSL